MFRESYSPLYVVRRTLHGSKRAFLCRCMACDRPLAKLDPDMGGFVPGPHMPISVSLEPSKNNGVVLSSKEGSGQGRSGASRKGPPAAQHSRTALHAQQPQTGQTP